jgi:hypothetical protein
VGLMPDLSDNIIWRLIQDFLDLLWYPFVFLFLPYCAYVIVRGAFRGVVNWFKVDVFKEFSKMSRRDKIASSMFWGVFPLTVPISFYLLGVRFLGFPISAEVHRFLLDELMSKLGLVMLASWGILLIALLIERLFKFKFFDTAKRRD